MLFVYAGMLLLFFLQGSHFLQKNKGRGYCVLAAVFLAGISAMKKITANGDLLGYLARYQTLSVQSYRFLWEAWQNGDMKDFGFYAAGKAFADFGLGAEVWMGAIAVFFAACFGWFIYRHSQQRFLSVLILLTLYFNFTLSGLRQTMAMAVIFAAFHFITEEKPVRFIAAVLLAFLFHSSALIFLPAYWIAKLEIGWKQIFFIGAALMIAVAFPNVFRELIDLLAWNEALEGYAERETALSWSGYLIQLFMVGFCLLFYKSAAVPGKERWQQTGAFLNCMVIGLCLQGFSAVVAEAFRLSYYYSICSVAAIPNIIRGHPNPGNRSVMWLGVGVSLTAYLLWSGAYRNLVYFWQV